MWHEDNLMVGGHFWLWVWSLVKRYEQNEGNRLRVPRSRPPAEISLSEQSRAEHGYGAAPVSQ